MDSNLPPENNPPPPPTMPPPPPLNRPPPLIGPMPSARPVPVARRGRGWKVAAIILLPILALSLLFNLRHVAGSLANVKGGGGYRTAGPRLEELTIREARGASKIAVVNVDGVI